MTTWKVILRKEFNIKIVGPIYNDPHNVMIAGEKRIAVFKSLRDKRAPYYDMDKLAEVS